MMYTPIKKQKLHELIIHQIKQSIEDGQLSPGDKLPSERELAALFSVSRGAVREAISVLGAKGLITVKPGIGNFLSSNPKLELIELFNSISNEEHVLLVELLELRQSIEGQAAYYAAQRRTEQDLEKIEDALARLEQSVSENQVAAEEDFKFHFSVIEASHNSMMVHTFQLVSGACMKGLFEARIDALDKPGKPQQVLAEHREIYQAIKDADPERARLAMIVHLENVKVQVSASMQETE